MRRSSVIAFGAGFASGLVFLTLLLWQSGRLRNTAAAAAPPPASVQVPAAPAPKVSTAPPPVVREPAQPSVAAIPSTGFPRRLLLPVTGVRPADLRENFNEMRGGHRHEALDIMAPRGTPVLAADEGNVVKLFLSKPGGLTVYQFDNSGTYCYYYAHLDRYAPGLKEGTLLRKGDVLGYVGSTGDASPDAPHLHFAIFQLGPEKHWWQGEAIDPYPILAASPSPAP